MLTYFFSYRTTSTCILEWITCGYLTFYSSWISNEDPNCICSPQHTVFSQKARFLFYVCSLVPYLLYISRKCLLGLFMKERTAKVPVSICTWYFLFGCRFYSAFSVSFFHSLLPFYSFPLLSLESCYLSQAGLKCLVLSSWVCFLIVEITSLFY